MIDMNWDGCQISCSCYTVVSVACAKRTVLCAELKGLHDRIRAQAVTWFNSMTPEVKANVSAHYGVMPRYYFFFSLSESLILSTYYY